MKTNSLFFEILGYLAAPRRKTKLDAEVPVNSRKRFETKYYELTGAMPKPDNRNYYVLHQNADKWGIELRIYFVMGNNTPTLLKAMIVRPRPGTIYNARVNDNEFIWTLIRHGFRLGDRQDLLLIQSKVPKRFLQNFQNGLNMK